MNGALLGAIRDATGVDPVDELDTVLHVGSRGAWGCSLIFVFRAGQPLVVAKFGRSSDTPVERELAGLRSVAAIVAPDSRLGSTIEPLVGEARLDDGRLVLLKAFLPGRPALQYIAGHASRAREVLHDAARWQVEFLAAIRDWLITDPHRKTALATAVCAGGQMPEWWSVFVNDDGHVCGPTHGDFLLTNILVRDGHLASVVDFENFAMDGFPIADFIGLLVGAGTTFLGETDDDIDRMFLGHTWVSDAIRDEVQFYCREVGLSVESLVSVLPIYTDRAIMIARAWKMQEKEDFHVRVRSFLIGHRENILRAWT